MGSTCRTRRRSSEYITRRENEILFLMAQGYVTKEIAFKLHRSIDTIHTHVKNIYRKTGTHNKIEALNKTKWLTAS